MLATFRCAALLLLTVPAPTIAQVLQPASAAVRPETQWAYFSPQRAFAESAEGKTAQGTLSAFQEQKTKEIAARNQRLEAQRASLQQSATVLDEAARRRREAEIERFQVDLKRFTEDAQAEFLGVQKAVESAFLAKLRPALDFVAKEKKLLLVLDEDTGLIAWADKSLDITTDVIRRLDQPPQ